MNASSCRWREIQPCTERCHACGVCSEHKTTYYVFPPLWPWISTILIYTWRILRQITMEFQKSLLINLRIFVYYTAFSICGWMKFTPHAFVTQKETQTPHIWKVFLKVILIIVGYALLLKLARCSYWFKYSTDSIRKERKTGEIKKN